jgi:hypothetical protein
MDGIETLSPGIYSFTHLLVYCGDPRTSTRPNNSPTHHSLAVCYNPPFHPLKESLIRSRSNDYHN